MSQESLEWWEDHPLHVCQVSWYRDVRFAFIIREMYLCVCLFSHVTSSISLQVSVFQRTREASSYHVCLLLLHSCVCIVCEYGCACATVPHCACWGQKAPWWVVSPPLFLWSRGMNSSHLLCTSSAFTCTVCLLIYELLILLLEIYYFFYFFFVLYYQ